MAKKHEVTFRESGFIVECAEDEYILEKTEEAGLTSPTIAAAAPAPAPSAYRTAWKENLIRTWPSPSPTSIWRRAIASSVSAAPFRRGAGRVTHGVERAVSYVRTDLKGDLPAHQEQWTAAEAYAAAKGYRAGHALRGPGGSRSSSTTSPPSKRRSRQNIGRGKIYPPT